MASAVACAPHPAVRRRLLRALAAMLVAAPVAARATDAANDDEAMQRLFAGLRRWGSGEFRRFGFLVYEATLWAGDDPQRPPLVLRLTYRRAIAGKAIAAASVDEIRRLGLADAATVQRWGALLAELFPDVAHGDSITGHYLPGGVRFVHNGRPLGAIDDAQFAHAFFAI